MALERIDMAVQPVVAGVDLTVPPSGANAGDAYIVGSDATGEWAGHDDALVMMGEGGWVFLAALEGLAVYDIGARAVRRFVASSWQAETLVGALTDPNGDHVVGARQGAVLCPMEGARRTARHARQSAISSSAWRLTD